MRSKLRIDRPDWPCDEHHVYPGPYRKASDRWGCVVYIPHIYHLGPTGPHQCRETADRYKRAYQEQLEAAGWTRQEFMETFGRNYL